MINLIEKLNEQSQNKYNFTLQSATLDSAAAFCVINIFYDDHFLISKEEIEQLNCVAREVLPQKYKYEINFVKNYYSEERVTEEIIDFMHKNFSSMSFEIRGTHFKNIDFEAEIAIENLAFEHAKEKQLKKSIESHLAQKFNGLNFNLNFTSFEKEIVETKKTVNSQNDDSWRQKRIIKIIDPVMLVGDAVEGDARYMMDQTVAVDDLKVCGKIKAIKSIEIKRNLKTKQGEDGENSKSSETETKSSTEEYKKMMFFFTLQDFTGEIRCKIIANKETQPKLEKLSVGSMLACEGKLESDDFTGGLVLSVKKISYCSEPKETEEYIEFLPEKENYEYVFPEQITIYKQDDLMSFSQEQIVPKYLQNKTFVCYDLETTGLSFEAGDKMIEIGAIKIENGKITQRFMSYVNPEKPIPKDASAISGIVDDDVKDAPKDFEVLGDFFKFSRGAILIGYNNISFDNRFLIGQGRRTRWNFDNSTEDVFKFAQKFVHGVGNYKLGTVAKHLGVSLDNAHRAVYDALATAEIFLKIAEKM